MKACGKPMSSSNEANKTNIQSISAILKVNAMSSKKLEKALALTNEEQADAFERFANAFLVDDYPALEPLGGKKDKGMDARVIQDETGKNLLVVQSCVSPSNK